jgi:hypothetical protein
VYPWAWVSATREDEKHVRDKARVNRELSACERSIVQDLCQSGCSASE